MKTTEHSSKTQIHGGNLLALEDTITGETLLFPNSVGLLAVIADMFDDIAKGREYYMIVGATSNKSAFSVTVKSGQTIVAQVYGGTLEEISTKVLDLL